MLDESFEFRPLDRIARMLRFWLILGAIVSLVAGLSDLIEIQLLSRIAAGEELSVLETDANDNRQGLIAIIQALVMLATVVSCVSWCYRSRKNLPALGATYLQYSPGWTIGGFFVPIMSLYRPFQVMKEVWRGSIPEDSTITSAMPVGELVKERAPRIVWWWWALFLVSAFFGQISMRLMFRDDPTMAMLQATSWTSFGSNAVDIPGLLVTAALVQAITAGQAEQWKRLMISPRPPFPTTTW